MNEKRAEARLILIPIRQEFILDRKKRTWLAPPFKAVYGDVPPSVRGFSPGKKDDEG